VMVFSVMVLSVVVFSVMVRSALVLSGRPLILGSRIRMVALVFLLLLFLRRIAERTLIDCIPWAGFLF